MKKEREEYRTYRDCDLDQYIRDYNAKKRAWESTDGVKLFK
jgi:hypothetical protein